MIYEDLVLEIACFFYKLGHRKVSNKIIDKIEIEKEAWRNGSMIAKKCGITFPPYVYKWATEQVKIYERNI